MFRKEITIEFFGVIQEDHCNTTRPGFRKTVIILEMIVRRYSEMVLQAVCSTTHALRVEAV